MKKNQKTLLVAVSEMMYGGHADDMEGVLREADRMVELVQDLHLDDEEKEELVLRVSCALLGARRMTPPKAVEAALHLYDLVEKVEEGEGRAARRD